MSKFKVKAICPGCRKTYMARMEYEWKGRGVVRVYCPSCKKNRRSQNRGIRAVRI